MQFELNEEQQALADSVAKQAPALFPFQARGRRGAAFDASKWQEIVDLGWVALTLPETAGGMGLPVAAAAPIFEALGAHLALLPYAPSLQAAALLAGDQHLGLVQAMGEGKAIVVPALGEAGSDFGALPAACRVEKSATGLQLHGEKRAVAWGGQATHWIVSALHAGEVSIWLVPADSQGVQIKAYAGLDDKHLADLRFTGTALAADACIAQGAAAQALLADADAIALAAACAEGAGAMAALHALTLDYVKTRKQFGKAIGSFQALQHRLADMLVKVELAKSLAAVALAVADDAAMRESRLGLLQAAKVQMCQSARFIGEQAVQLHGGIGLTNECQASHYARRLLALDKLHGDANLHLGRLADALV